MAADPAGLQWLATPAIVAHLLDNPTTLFLTRICMTLPFWVGGLVKLSDWRGGVIEMETAGLRPGWAFNLAVIIVELAGSALVIADRATWLGAGMLGAFTFLSTFIAHRFWRMTGAARTAELNSFLEHATICSAFILIVVVSLHGSAGQ